MNPTGSNGTLRLVLIHIVLYVVFVIVTAYEGVLLIPFFSFIGIYIVGFAQNTAHLNRVILLFGAIAIIAVFFYGLRRRAHWYGCAINVIAVYAWFALSIAALTYLSP